MVPSIRLIAAPPFARVFREPLTIGGTLAREWLIHSVLHESTIDPQRTVLSLGWFSVFDTVRGGCYNPNLSRDGGFGAPIGGVMRWS